VIDARSTLRRRFVTLTALRWLSSGLLVPVFVVLLKARDLSVSHVGVIFAVYTGVAALLEVPTGGLADTWGRRPTLLTASATTMIGLFGLSISTDVAMLAASASILAVGRALGSGPLDAWFVDHMRTAEPGLDLTADLAAGARAQGLALAVGTVAGSLLPYAGRGMPADGDAFVLRFSIPVLVAAALAAIELVCVNAYIDEPQSRPHARLRAAGSIRAAARIAATDATVRRILIRFALVGAGIAAFEILIPLRLATLTGSASSAATIYAVAFVVAFVLGALAAPASVPLTRRLPTPFAAAAVSTAAAGLVAMGASIPATAAAVLAVIGLEVLSSPAGPVLRNLLHDHADAASRATLLSLLSLATMAGAFVGSLAFPVIVTHTSMSLGLLLAGGAIVLAAAPLAIRSPPVVEPAAPELARHH
jgi:predicted MFS family arabinose efflux permease